MVVILRLCYSKPLKNWIAEYEPPRWAESLSVNFMRTYISLTRSLILDSMISKVCTGKKVCGFKWQNSVERMKWIRQPATRSQKHQALHSASMRRSLGSQQRGQLWFRTMISVQQRRSQILWLNLPTFLRNISKQGDRITAPEIVVLLSDIDFKLNIWTTFIKIFSDCS